MSRFSGNWAEFMGCIASMLRAGHDESSLSSEFCGASVTWEGKVLEKRLDEDYARGVSLAMSPGIVALDHGKVLRGDYLFVNVSAGHGDEWRNIDVGAEIVFTARISSEGGPFPDIHVSEMEGCSELVLMVGIHQGRISSILQE